MRRKKLTALLCVWICIANLFTAVTFQNAEPVFAETGELSVEAVISSPTSTYEGHTEIIEDASRYTVGSKTYTTEEAYRQGLVSVSFDTEDYDDVIISSAGKEKWRRKVLFENTGRKKIIMTVTASDGRVFTASRSISVNKAPDIEYDISGAQKVNRLLVYNATIACNPYYPLEKTLLTITDTEGDVLAEASESGRLKARPTEIRRSEDGEFYYLSKQFTLTGEAPSDLIISLYAEDERGQKRTVSERVHISEDLAPESSFELDEVNVREEGQNYAVIRLHDTSTSDGDQLVREWYCKDFGDDSYVNVNTMPGYEDLSAGDGSLVQFHKEGVGQFSVKLRVSDSWSEGRLEEFTSDVELKGDECTRDAEVVNIAPRVSLGLSTANEKDIVMLADVSSADSLSADRGRLEAELLDKGIRPSFSLETFDSQTMGSLAEGQLKETMSARGPFGYNGSSTSYESGLYAVDDKKMYRLDATWSDSDNGYPEEPYSLTAYDADSGNVAWQIVFDKTFFAVSNSGSDLYQDDTGEYLYLVSGGRTILIDKSNGQRAGTLECSLGGSNFVRGRYIYTFRSDGIYRADLKTGKSENIYKAQLSGAVRRIGGCAVTYTISKNGTISKLELDLARGQVDSSYFATVDENLLAPSGYRRTGGISLNVAGIDVEGRCLLECITSLKLILSTSSYASGVNVMAFNERGERTRVVSYVDSRQKRVVPVTDEHGRFNYFATSSCSSDSVTVNLYSATGSGHGSYTFYDSNGYPAVYSNIIYSIQQGSQVNITLGGFCAWIYNSGFANGGMHGYPERCSSIVFDTGSMRGSSASLPAGCTGFSEYSRSSADYTVIKTSKNCQYSSMAEIETRVVKRGRSSYDLLLEKLHKYTQAEKDDDRLLVIYADELKTDLSQEEADKLKNYMASVRCNIVILADDEEAGKRVADLTGGRLVLRTDAYLSEIAELASDETDQYESVTSVSCEEGNESGSLSRSFSLKDNTEYSYSFIVESDSRPEGLLSCTDDLYSPVKNQYLTDRRLYVTKEVVERFSSVQPSNNAFSYSSYVADNGKYTDCYMRKSTSGNAYYTDSSTITFTIPEGSRALLSFDYQIKKYNSSQVNSAFASVDGERWYIAENAQNGNLLNGNYTHPVIMGPGTHRLYIFCGGYGGKNMEAFFYLDNLNLRFLSDEMNNTDTVSENIVNLGGGRYKVTGKIKTPGLIRNYRALASAQRSSFYAGAAPYSTYSNNSNSETNTLRLLIPDGKTALLADIGVRSGASNSYFVTYTWNDTGQSWSYRGGLKYPQQYLSYIASDWRLRVNSCSGTKTFTASYDSYRGTSANYADIKLYLADSGAAAAVAGLIAQNSYAFSGATSECVYFPGDQYSGSSTLTIKLGKDVKSISDFDLYIADSGMKLDIEEDGFKSEYKLSKWTSSGVKTAITRRSVSDNKDQTASEIPVFEKGQIIDYNIVYSDYEDDPSLKSFWRYTHTPMSDGPHEQASVVLDNHGGVVSENDFVLSEPITRFYKDGKYTVEHWQVDDTSRGINPAGNPGYDKSSNVVSLTFYIRGDGEAPWIRYIKTQPEEVHSGDNLGLRISVDDSFKETLILKTEVYSEGVLLYENERTDINADIFGDYPEIVIDDAITSIPCGRYQVVCRVSDEHAEGMDTYSFTVLSAGSLTGLVTHTEKWDKNRRLYNIYLSGNEYNEEADCSSYTAARAAPRASNVFWPGEALCLQAEVTGDPESVKAYIKEYGQESQVELSMTGEELYEGRLCADVASKKLSCEPCVLTAVFSADYGSGGEELLYEVPIVVDGRQSYWRLRRIAL